MTVNLPDPPHLDAERLILGAALVDPVGVFRDAGWLTGEDFAGARHGAAWELLRELLPEVEGEPVPAVALDTAFRDRLSRDPDLRHHLTRGGTPPDVWLPALGDRAFPEAVPTHARQVREAALRRRLAREAHALAAELEAGPLTDGAVHADRLEALARDLRRGARPVDLDTAAPAVGRLLDPVARDLEDRVGGRLRERAAPLPWPSTAAALGGGLLPGWLYVLVGNPGAGKSQWIMQAAACAAADGCPVLYVGLELGPLDLVARLLGLRTGRRWSALAMGEDPGAPGLLRMNREALDALPLHLETGGPFGWDYTRLRPMAEALAARYGRPPLVVLDYLQLVSSPPGVREDLRERVGRAAYQGRAVARDLGATVVLVSSTARGNYADLAGRNRDLPGKGDPGRLLGVGKEAGEVEYAGDALLVLAETPWREVDGERVAPLPPDPDTVHGCRESLVWLALAKMRARSAGHRPWIPFRFDGSRFREVTLDVARAAGGLLPAPAGEEDGSGGSGSSGTRTRKGTGKAGAADAGAAPGGGWGDLTR